MFYLLVKYITFLSARVGQNKKYQKQLMAGGFLFHMLNVSAVLVEVCYLVSISVAREREVVRE